MLRRFTLPVLAAAMTLTACATPRNFNAAPGFQNNPALNAQFSRQSTTNHEIVNIRWNSLQEYQTLATSGLDILNTHPESRQMEARVSTQELQQLQQEGVQVERAVFQSQSAETRAPFPNGYMTYAQMTQRIKALAQKYPQLVRLEDVGDTVSKQQGRADHDIWAVHVGANRNSQTQYLMIGGIHARELAPVEILMKLMDLLTAGYGKDPRITQILDNSTVVFMPMVNVDGRVMVEEGEAWQRKNAAGVDLNRNFDNHWNFQGLNVPSSWLRGVTDPGSQIYSGPRPASEPETQVVQAMFHRLKPALAVDMHAHGDMMLWPLGYSYDDNAHTPVFQELFNRTFKNIGFKGGTSAQILYPTTATTRDYAYEQHKAISMTLEIGDDFRPSYGEVEQMWGRMQPHLLTLLETPGIR